MPLHQDPGALAPPLTEHLPVPDIQHGFRKHHSTITALHDFNQNIADGFNKKKPPDRTVLLQIDLSKAFDMVSHEKLLRDLNKTKVPDTIKRWFNTYLHGRQSRVNFRNKTSNARNVKTGVPQGAVTSPILFNFYLFNLPTPPEGVKLVQYADDISVYASGTSINSLCQSITDYTTKLIDFLAERNLIVSPEKSTVTLFTPDTKEANIHPPVKIADKLVKLDKCPKLLGTYFDTMYTFSKHIKETVSKAKLRINIMKSLAGSSWGQDKETLVMTYKSICRSTLEYASPIWAPAISESNWTRLQTVQNQALRVATGCLLMSSSSHLHQETKVLPLREHTTMLSKQLLAAFHQNVHPGHKHLQKPKASRNLKKTILQYEEEVNLLFRGATYKDNLKTIHTRAVSTTISNYPVNRVLQTAPPEINPEEMALERNVRTRLARLRSGFCRTLQSYMSRVEEDETDSCPLCNISPHDTVHLFNCASNPTDLQPTDLWTKPKKVAIFLNLITTRNSDDDLPADDGG